MKCAPFIAAARLTSALTSTLTLSLTVGLCGTAHASGDFSALTALAQGAITGSTLATPLAGFELLVLQNGTPIYNQAFGTYSVGQLINADSATKTISAGVLMAEIERTPGFTLDTTIGSLLPFVTTPVKSAITVRQLFTHEGAFPSSGSSGALTNGSLTLQASAQLITNLSLLFTPGTKFSYGGEGIQVAGAAMEVAGGKSFVNLYNDLIGNPLQLTHTSWALASTTNPRVAGGLETTAADYGRFMDMLLNGGVDRVTGVRVLSKASVDEMLKLQVDPSVPLRVSPTGNTRYGIGVWLDQLDNFGPKVDALALGARGFNSWIDEANGLTFVFATEAMALGGDLKAVMDLSSKMHAAVLSAVPEPVTWALWGAGVAALALRIRRQALGAQAA